MVSLDAPVSARQGPAAWQRVVERYARQYGGCRLLGWDPSEVSCPRVFARAGPARRAGLDWELRDYAPGDDPRQIDWALCARRDDLLVRVRRPRGDRRAAVLVDCSGSMLLGRPSKFELACHLAAALAAASLTSGMRWQSAAFAQRLTVGLAPVRGRDHLGRALRFLAGLAARQEPTDLATSLGGFARVCRQPSVVVVISDVDDPVALARGAGELLQSGHQVRLVQVFDPREAAPDARGEVELFDVETGRVERVVVTERILRRYAELYAGVQESIRSWCRRHGVPQMRMASNIDRQAAIEQLFRGCPASRL